MPSFLASAVPHDPEALIAALVAATRDRFPYSRADGTCSSCSYVIQRTRRIIREVEKMRQVNEPPAGPAGDPALGGAQRNPRNPSLKISEARGAGDGNQSYSGIVPVARCATLNLKCRKGSNSKKTTCGLPTGFPHSALRNFPNFPFCLITWL